MPVDDNCRSMADVIPFAILLLLPPEQLCRIVEFVFLHVRYLLNFKPYFQQVNSPIPAFREVCGEDGLCYVYAEPVIGIYDSRDGYVC